MTATLAHRLVFLVARAGLSPPLALEFFEVAAQVRRLELFADEVVANAQEDEAMIMASDNVVNVDFIKGVVS